MTTDRRIASTETGQTAQHRDPLTRQILSAIWGGYFEKNTALEKYIGFWPSIISHIDSPVIMDCTYSDST